MEQDIEQERLRKAFNIKPRVSQVEQPEQNLSNDPRLQLARRVLAERERVDITEILKEIADAIDAGKRGVAQGKVREAQKIIAGNNVSRQERELLEHFEDMLK